MLAGTLVLNKDLQVVLGATTCDAEHMRSLVDIKKLVLVWMGAVCVGTGITLSLVFAPVEEGKGFNTGWFFGGPILAFIVLLPVWAGFIALERLVDNQRVLDERLAALNAVQ
ncbi:MAG: hypothetical protein CVT64_11460 [Actinobacteria bacterium HGW-Actinobacteria-4]|nr:MAG: hypothetical protein CVT64_11460 [Actinobacteria bacterium HGW-Actinobacteria-4]